MSTLLAKIKGDIRQAMIAKNEVVRNVLRVVVGEVERRLDATGSDEEVTKVIRKLIEGNNESIRHFDNEALRMENFVLQGYLPTMLTVDEITKVLTENVDKIKGAKNEGQAVGAAMGIFKAAGSAVDGKDVKLVVQQIRG